MAADNYVAFLNFVEQHGDGTCSGEIRREASGPDDSVTRFTCDVCDDVFVMTGKTRELIARIQKANSTGGAV